MYHSFSCGCSLDISFRTDLDAAIFVQAGACKKIEKNTYLGIWNSSIDHCSFSFEAILYSTTSFVPPCFFGDVVLGPYHRKISKESLCINLWKGCGNNVE